MSVSALLERLQAAKPGETLDWRQIRQEIHDLHDQSTTTAERITLLGIFTAVMDRVERSGLTGTDLKTFQATRGKDYNLLLIKESRVGTNICPETLFQVTEREVAAGRMAADEPLRVLAVEGMAAPHLSRAALIAIAEEEERKANSLFSRIAAWLKNLFQ